MQTDPSVYLQIKLAGPALVHKVENKTTAKSLDVSLSNVENI